VDRLIALSASVISSLTGSSTATCSMSSAPIQASITPDSVAAPK
jgi:hypothetical protein